MINLIPPDAQKQVQREYWIRVVSVWFFLLGTAFVLVALFYVPTYLLLQLQLTGYAAEYADVTSQTGEFKDAEVAIKHANEIAILLTNEKKEVLFSTIISEIEKITTEGITINSFALSRKGVDLNTIAVTGIAKTRANLSNFQSAIENNILFKSASLPLSNLTKDKDIPFSITITPKSSVKESS